MPAKKERETQSQNLKKQLDKTTGSTPTTSSSATKDKIIANLRDPNFHGKKTDIPTEWIQFGSNQRKEIGDVSSLKSQIKESGLLQPIGIQLLDDEITCVYGNRRLQAFKELSKEDRERFETISCIIQVYGNPEQGRIIAQAIENLGREDLSPLDECIAIAETKAALTAKSGTPVTNEQLGEFLGGRHRKTIEFAIAIASWSESAHAVIRSNPDRFSITTLRNLARKNLPEDQLIQALEKELIEPIAEPKKYKEIPFYERPRRDQLKNFDSFLQTVEATPEMSEFLKKQNKWLWSKEARGAIRKVLNEYFED